MTFAELQTFLTRNKLSLTVSGVGASSWRAELYSLTYRVTYTGRGPSIAAAIGEAIDTHADREARS